MKLVVLHIAPLKKSAYRERGTVMTSDPQERPRNELYSVYEVIASTKKLGG
jgi:hypothetical protein